MPIRIDQHQLEDISRAKFQLLLPRKWVFRDKDKDYGIDGEVELFDKNNKAQGDIFWVQLKATESKKNSTIMNVDLSIETLKYYKTLPVPVLLVRYSDYDESFFIKWINNVDFFHSKPNAKTLRIKLTEKDRWTKTSINNIEERLSNLRKLNSGRIGFPLNLHINLSEPEINGVKSGILLNQIRIQLKKYSEYVIFSKIENESLIIASINNQDLKINICDLCGCSFHGIGLQKIDSFSEQLSKDILLGIAVSLIQINQIEYAGRLIFENKLESSLLKYKDLVNVCLTPLFQSSHFEKTIELVNSILDETESIESDLITTVNLLFGNPIKSDKKNEAVELFLSRKLDRSLKIGDDIQIGISHYNLGNHYKGRRLKLKAINHYILAKKIAPIYLKQPYFFTELAGMFFMIEKYRIAAKLYFKAIELGSAIETKALYANALMFSGEYKKAVDVFLDYLENTDSPIEEFVLKSMCLEGILEEYKIDFQKRESKKANELADVSKLDEQINSIPQLENALRFDLLSGLAWFNLGITYSDDDDLDQPALSFLMAALIQNEDIEAWKNATLCSFFSEETMNIIPLIIKTAYYFNGENYLSSLYEHFEKYNDSVDEIIELVDKILSVKEKENNLTEVRVLNKNGHFENILVNSSKNLPGTTKDSNG